MLNYGGVKPDTLPFVCDAAAAKQDKFMPGSHIPIFGPQVIIRAQPDYVLVLPWNIVDEVKSQLSQDLPNTQFVTAVPQLQIQ